MAVLGIAYPCFWFILKYMSHRLLLPFPQYIFRAVVTSSWRSVLFLARKSGGGIFASTGMASVETAWCARDILIATVFCAKSGVRLFLLLPKVKWAQTGAAQGATDSATGAIRCVKLFDGLRTLGISLKRLRVIVLPAVYSTCAFPLSLVWKINSVPETLDGIFFSASQLNGSFQVQFDQNGFPLRRLCC